MKRSWCLGSDILTGVDAGVILIESIRIYLVCSVREQWLGNSSFFFQVRILFKAIFLRANFRNILLALTCINSRLTTTSHNLLLILMIQYILRLWWESSDNLFFLNKSPLVRILFFLWKLISQLTDQIIISDKKLLHLSRVFLPRWWRRLIIHRLSGWLDYECWWQRGRRVFVRFFAQVSPRRWDQLLSLLFDLL